MASSIVTVDYAKMILGIKTSADDLRLQAFLDTSTENVEAFCRRKFLQATYTDYLNGTNTVNLFVQNSPITAIASLYLDDSGNHGQGDGAFAASTLLTAGEDYELPYDGRLGDDCTASSDTTPCVKSGMIRRIGTVWSGQVSSAGGLCSQLLPGSGNIKITYTAGWTLEAMPSSLRTAVCLIAKVILRSAKFGNLLGSESWQGYSYSLQNPQAIAKYPELGSVRSMLVKYRRIL